jgi:hypothetical protein
MQYYIDNNKYIYSDIVEDWVRRLNQLIWKYSLLINIKLDKFYLNSYDYSDSKKTIRMSSIERLKIFIRKIINLVIEQKDFELSKIANKEIPVY